MIQQAADCANGKAPPPPELSLLWRCRQFSCLPEAGGYNDQDAPTMERAAAFDNVYSFIKRNRRGKDPMDYAGMDDSDRDMYQRLKDMGVKF